MLCCFFFHTQHNSLDKKNLLLHNYVFLFRNFFFLKKLFNGERKGNFKQKLKYTNQQIFKVILYSYLILKKMNERITDS